MLRQGTDRNRVSSDRVTPAPSPSETTGIPTQDSIDDQTPRGEDEYVMQKIVVPKRYKAVGYAIAFVGTVIQEKRTPGNQQRIYPKRRLRAIISELVYPEDSNLR